MFPYPLYLCILSYLVTPRIIDPFLFFSRSHHQDHILFLSSGIAITDYIIGKGAEPKLGAKVKITYEGSFPDGTIFDQRLTRGKPFSFRKGASNICISFMLLCSILCH